MMCRHSLLVLISTVLCSVNSMGMAYKSRLPTMLVVPARYAQLQVAFDIANRYNTLLVSYQGSGDTPEPLLHVWSGDKWIQISMQEYRTASFLTVRPDRVFMIGDEHVLPASLVDASNDWGSLVMSSPSSGTADIVNSFGKVAGFRRHDWVWFASRYNLDFQDLNASERRSSWYDRSPASVHKETWTREGDSAKSNYNKTVQGDDDSLKFPVYVTQETTNGTNQIESSVPRASVQTDTDIVIDNIPSVSDIQQNIKTTVGDTSTPMTTAKFKRFNLPSDWEEEAVDDKLLPLK